MTTTTYNNNTTHTCLTLTSPRIPSEILLQILENISYDNHHTLATLRAIHPRTRALLATYERSLVKTYCKRDSLYVTTHFPVSLETRGFVWLNRCYRRYDVVDGIFNRLLDKGDAPGVVVHNRMLVEMGFYLLYRVVEIPTHARRIQRLRTLPRDPLIAMYLALQHTVATACISTEWMRCLRYGRPMGTEATLVSADLDDSFAEASLEHGPDWMHDMFYGPFKGNSAEVALLNAFHEFKAVDWRPIVDEGQEEEDGSEEGTDTLPLPPWHAPVTQGPWLEEKTARLSLWATLQRRLAFCIRFPIQYGRSFPGLDQKIGEMTIRDGHPLARLSVSKQRRLMEGLNVV